MRSIGDVFAHHTCTDLFAVQRLKPISCACLDRKDQQRRATDQTQCVV
jgi:hypothetical protein